MSLFIIGGDTLGKLEYKMAELGFNDIIHLSGRKKGVCRNFQLPRGVDMVLVLTDYVNHNLMQKVKLEARSKGIKLFFARGVGPQLIKSWR